MKFEKPACILWLSPWSLSAVIVIIRAIISVLISVLVVAVQNRPKDQAPSILARN